MTDPQPELVESFDGSLLAARQVSDAGATPLLVSNAVGANLAVWRKPLIDVVRSHTCVTWDHRGLLSSPPARTDRRDPGTHAEDALAVLDHFAIDGAFVVGWSNGTRIALEIAQRAPERVAGLVLVCPTYGHGLYDLVRHLDPSPILPLVSSVAKHFAGYMEAPLRRLVERPEITGLIRQSGIVGAEAETEGLLELLRGLVGCDLKAMLATYEAVAGDPSPELLTGIEVDTLLVAGAHDRFAPLWMAERMRREIPNSELEVYERATHYLPLEYPVRLSDDLRSFLKRVESSVTPSG